MKVVFRSFAVLATILTAATATTITTYDSRAAFLGDVSPVTNISFSGALIPSGSQTTNYSDAAGLTMSGVNFKGIVGTGYWMYAVSTSFCCQTHNRGDHINGPSFPQGADPHTLITLPANTYAAGLDLWSVTLGDGAGILTDTLQILVNGTTYLVDTKAFGDGTGKVFFGFKSDTPIASFEIRPTGATAYPQFADFVFGGQASNPPGVPEPCTLVLLGTGLIVFAAQRYLRH